METVQGIHLTPMDMRRCRTLNMDIMLTTTPLPPVADASVQLIVSRTVYSSLTCFDIDLSIPVDPGIPKHIG
jgi:hypothetical protein